MKNKLSVIALVAGLSVSAQAATIVQWGATGGDTGIVTSSGNGANSTPTTYDAATLYNPSGTLGYNDADPARTNKFSGAATKNQNNNFVDNSSGDYIQLLANVGTSGAFEGMLAWNGGTGSSGQSAFLSSEQELETLQVEFRGRDGNTNPTVNFVLETSAGWYVSTQDAQATGSNWTTFSSNIADLTWTGYSQFGVTAGSGTPDTADFVSVGFYLSDTNIGGNFSGGMVRHFQATAVPEPSSLALIALGSLGLLRRRR